MKLCWGFVWLEVLLHIKNWLAKAGNSRSVHDTPAINSPQHHLVRRTKKSSSFLILVTEIIEIQWAIDLPALVLGICVVADRDE